MKHLSKYAWGLALALCGMLLVSTAQAQEDYGIYKNSNDGAFSTSGSATSTTFTAVKDASLTFTIMQSVEDAKFLGLPLGYSKNSNSPIALGVYTYGFDVDGNIEIRDSTVFTNLRAGDMVNTADVLEIKADDMVGMYVQRTGQTSAIETSYLTPGAGLGGLPSSTVQKAQYAQGSSDGLGYFEMDGSWPTDPNTDIDVLVKIAGAAPAEIIPPDVPTGAPLPGVVATVALCGAVGGYFNRRKKAIAIE